MSNHNYEPASKAVLKSVKRLHFAKDRLASGQVLLEGPRLIGAAAQAGVEIEQLFVDSDQSQLAHPQVDAHETYSVDATQLKAIATTQTPQGVVAVANWQPNVAPMSPDSFTANSPAPIRRLLILDDVADPGNVGTLIRTAAGLGVDAVVVTAGSCDVTNPKVLRAAAGANFTIPIWSRVPAGDVADAIKSADLPLVGAVSTGGLDLGESGLVALIQHGWALAIGSEAHGLSSAISDRLTTSVTIPLHHEVESFNASAAGAILLYELMRLGQP